MSAAEDHVRPPAGTEEPDEVVDALPVLAQEASVVRERQFAGEVARAGTIPAVQAAAVAAGGFVAGAAVVGLVTLRQRHSAALANGRRGSSRLRRSRNDSFVASELVQIVGSRSFLVDVHLLGSRRA
ncbi:MAG TPA: hypothetical protein VGX69_02600 [Solirubrobacteraceae bacterium]|jgi:hypothetical protein|nr:hypothetical protein [Solirubrobacteraceae bacterium]